MSNSTPSQRATPRVGLSLDRSGGANPDDAAAADINTIVAHYKKHGVMPAVALQNPLYGDFTFGDDLHEMRNAMFEAENRFNQLPSAVRAAANNDWAQFVDLFDTEDGQQTLIDAGLIISENPENPQPPSFSTPPSPDTLQPPNDKPTSSDDS